MGTSNEQCSRAVAAAREVIREACDDEDGVMVEVADEVFAFVPSEDATAFDFEIGLDGPDRAVQDAIDSCVSTEWATAFADSLVGEDAPVEARHHAKRTACEGLVTS